MSGAKSDTPTSKDETKSGPATRTWGRHLINLRFSVPLPRGRFFLTLIGGREKRSLDRRREERKNFPLRTAGNLLFFIGVAAFFLLLAALSMALQSSLIEY